MAGYVFDKRAVERIVRSVLATEKQLRNPNSPLLAEPFILPFGFVRGKAVVAFSSTTHTIQIRNVEPLGQGAPLPADPLTVVNVPHASGSAGDTVYAIYNYATVYPGTGTTNWVGTGTGTGEGNWEIFETSSSSSGGRRAMIIANVPAASMSGTLFTCNPGAAAEAAVLLELGEDGNYSPIGFGTGTGTMVSKLAALWTGKTLFQASSSEPIIVTGDLVGTGTFVIGGETDLRSNTDFNKATAQSIGHGEDAYAQWQDDILCGTGTGT